MKVPLIILLILFIIIFFVAYSLGKNYQADVVSNDKNFQKFIQKNIACQSFSAESDLYEKGAKTGRTDFKLAGKDWQMTIMENEASTSSWIKLGSTVYIMDFQDGQWWQQENSNQPVLLSAIDFKAYLRQLTDLKNKYLQVHFLKRELCTEKLCLEYEIIDKNIQFPGRNSINHYIWFDEEDYSLKKEEYINGSGDISLTYYSGCNQTVIEKPEKTKKVPPGKDIFMLPLKVSRQGLEP